MNWRFLVTYKRESQPCITKKLFIAEKTVKAHMKHIINKLGADPVLKAFYDPEAVLGFIYTSGTTGQPKGVMVTNGNILADVHKKTLRERFWTR